MNGTDTIFALSTAPGRAGVAVFRLSGPKARFAVETIAAPLPSPRRASLRALRSPGDGSVIDRGLVLWMPGPHSFSGEDMAELHVHGSHAVTGLIAETLAGLDGLRTAEPGEFTRRAFENGRIDLTEAEGIADLIDAETDAQRRQAVRQMEGQVGRVYDGWRTRLLRALAWAEAELDFSDEEDVSAMESGRYGQEAADVRTEIAEHLADGHRGERLRGGVRVVIAGPPNAGKSTLMNAIARRDVAIVSERAGTTRDVIEVHLDIGGLPVILTDTAGLREAGDEIEEEGVKRARAALEAADLIVWVEAADARKKTVRPALQPGQQVLDVRTKIDLETDSDPVQSKQTAILQISVHRDWSIAALIARLGAEAAGLCGRGEAPVITRARHRATLESAEAALGRFVEADADKGRELLAEDLRQAVTALGRITGRVDVEDVLDVIFSDFCIGK